VVAHPTDLAIVGAPCVPSTSARAGRLIELFASAGIGTMATMLRRCTLCLLLVLFFCDFAMPLAPGAFRFELEKTVEITHDSVPRVTTPGVQLVGAQRPLLSSHRVIPQVPRAPRVARVAPTPLGHVFPLKAFRPEPEPASSEDH
jgi:hypothetical protein